MNDAQTSFRSRPRIGPERFGGVMREAGSPWAGRAGGLHELIASGAHDPAVWLAIGLREHRLLTDPHAVALKLATNSWTNARSVRLAGLDHEIVTTADLRRAGIEHRDGPYVRYRSVEDSLRDGMARVDDPDYVYRQRYAVTLEQVLSIWTEDDAAGYVRFVVERLNEWADGSAPDPRGVGAPPGTSFGLTWWDDPAFEFIPDRHGEYGYGRGSWGRVDADSGRRYEVDLLILHITAGVDSLPWLSGPHGNSAHYLTWPDGRPRAQLLPERDAAWAAGNREYNLRSINVEHEKLRLTDPWTEDEYRRLAWLSARIIRRNPGITPDRAHVIGHNEVPDPLHPGRFGGAGNHADPGPGFDWPRFIALLHEELDGRVDAHDPNALYFDATNKWIVNQGDVQMLDFWRSMGGIEVCGYPLEGMRRDEDGVYRQLTENLLLECWPDGFGRHPGPHYRFGGLGRRYAELRAAMPPC